MTVKQNRKSNNCQKKNTTPSQTLINKEEMKTVLRFPIVGTWERPYKEYLRDAASRSETTKITTMKT